MKNYFAIFQEVLQLEAQALVRTQAHIYPAQVEQLVTIYRDLLQSGSKMIFCGVGKSGIIGQKLAATFCSLGLKAIFLHPIEALHGDLGLADPLDAIVLISKSGNTEEILKLLPFLPLGPERIIGLLGDVDSKIGQKCHLVFDCSVEKEACVVNQAPTTSTTVALGVGDAMGVVFSALIDLSREGFAAFHPGGMLGKSLRLKVQDIMQPSDACPQLAINATFQDVVLAMTEKPVGACAVVEPATAQLLGIIVEGDFRRTLLKEGWEKANLLVSKIMNPQPVWIGPTALAFDGLKLMQQRQRPFDILPVLGADGRFLGILRIHDLWKEGLKLGPSSEGPAANQKAN